MNIYTFTSLENLQKFLNMPLCEIQQQMQQCIANNNYRQKHNNRIYLDTFKDFYLIDNINVPCKYILTSRINIYIYKNLFIYDIDKVLKDKFESYSYKHYKDYSYYNFKNCGIVANKRFKNPNNLSINSRIKIYNIAIEDYQKQLKDLKNQKDKILKEFGYKVYRKKYILIKNNEVSIIKKRNILLKELIKE